MSPYKLVIHDKAIEDSKRIKDYIKYILLNSGAADNFIEKFDKKVIKISKNPHIYPADRFGKYTYRYSMVNRYMVVFRIDEQMHTVHIIAVGHSLQKRKNILK